MPQREIVAFDRRGFVAFNQNLAITAIFPSNGMMRNELKSLRTPVGFTSPQKSVFSIEADSAECPKMLLH